MKRWIQLFVVFGVSVLGSVAIIFVVGLVLKSPMQEVNTQKTIHETCQEMLQGVEVNSVPCDELIRMTREEPVCDREIRLFVLRARADGVCR